MDKWQWSGAGISVIAIALPITGALPPVVGWGGVIVGTGMILYPFIYPRFVNDDAIEGADPDLRTRSSSSLQTARGRDRVPDDAAQIIAERFQQIISGPPLPGKSIESYRTDWAKLRASGVEMRNAGHTGFFRDSDWNDWEEAVVKWNADVIAAIKPVDEAEALWFATLDAVPPPRIAIDSSAREYHKHIYAMHDFRLVKLEQLIQQYRNKNTAVWAP